MPNMGISLTDQQRARLLDLKEKMGFRSFSATIGWLIGLKWESKVAYQERELIAGAQNPEQLEPTA